MNRDASLAAKTDCFENSSDAPVIAHDGLESLKTASDLSLSRRPKINALDETSVMAFMTTNATTTRRHMIFGLAMASICVTGIMR